MAKPNYPLFTSEKERDEYLAKLIANGYQVRRCVVVYPILGLRYTVEGIDKRKGR